MNLSDLIPGATYAIESVDAQGAPWKGLAIYIGPETSEDYSQVVNPLAFRCEDGMDGVFTPPEVKALVSIAASSRATALELVVNRLAALRSDAGFAEAVSYLPELGALVDQADATLAGKPFDAAGYAGGGS